MQFKSPEILYALFLLLIPIIIHFFRLRRFRREAFTNVALLLQVERQSRRMSQLKKWLLLLIRLLTLAALILAFAQPFVPQTEAALRDKETVIYIDNSLSMQQKGKRGELLQEAVQQILQSFPEEQILTVLTNDDVWKDQKLSALRNTLLQLDYSVEANSLHTVSLKAANLFSDKPEIQKQWIVISDFQQKDFENFFQTDTTIQTHFIQLKGHHQLNYSIDSVYIADKNNEAVEIEVKLSANTQNTGILPVSLYNDTQLLAKSSAGFDQDSIAYTRFSVARETDVSKGKLIIEDESLSFDNEFYFTLQQNNKVKIGVVDRRREDSDFLMKIWNKEEFDVGQFRIDQPDYNRLENIDFIVLNELKEIPVGLTDILKKHVDEGGYLSVIPSGEARVESYNRLFTALGLPHFTPFYKDTLKITTIHFDHPLYKGVFDQRVDNFQYPEVRGSFEIRGEETVLQYNNQRSFLSKTGRVYLFSAPLNPAFSNIKQSPLIVPTFYNMAWQSAQLPALFYTLRKNNSVAVPAAYLKDRVLHVSNKQTDFIPLQRQFHHKVLLQFSDLPQAPGHYEVTDKADSIATLSFNYDRSENQWQFVNFNSEDGFLVSHDIKKYFEEENRKNQVRYIWKWFLTFAFIFALTEFGLIRFLK